MAPPSEPTDGGERGGLSALVVWDALAPASRAEPLRGDAYFGGGTLAPRAWHRDQRVYQLSVGDRAVGGDRDRMLAPTGVLHRSLLELRLYRSGAAGGGGAGDGAAASTAAKARAAERAAAADARAADRSSSWLQVHVLLSQFAVLVFRPVGEGTRAPPQGTGASDEAAGDGVEAEEGAVDADEAAEDAAEEAGGADGAPLFGRLIGTLPLSEITTIARHAGDGVVGGSAAADTLGRWLTLGAGGFGDGASARPHGFTFRADAAADATRWACEIRRARDELLASARFLDCAADGHRVRRVTWRAARDGADPNAGAVSEYVLARALAYGGFGLHDGAIADGAIADGAIAPALRRGCVFALPVSRALEMHAMRAARASGADAATADGDEPLDLGRVARADHDVARRDGVVRFELEAGVATVTLWSLALAGARAEAARARGGALLRVGVERAFAPGGLSARSERNGDGPRDVRPNTLELRLEVAFVEPAEVASLYWFANATTPAADEAPDTVHDSAGANASASRAQGVSRVAAFIVPMCALLLAARDLRAVLTQTLLAPLLLLLALSLAAAAVAAGLAAVALARESEADAARDAATAAHAAAVAPLDAVVRAPQRPWRRTRARLARLVRVLSECDYYPRQRTRGSRVQRQASARGVRGGRTMRVRLVDWRWTRAAPPVADGGVGDPAVAAAAAASSSGSPSRAAEAAVEAAAPPCCPPRFLCAVRGDREKALERWRETEAWRREHPWRATLSRPQPHFERIKQLHRHFIHRTDRAGHPVFYEIIERPNAKFRELREHGVELRDVIAHFHFLYEWLYRVEARARERRNHDIFALVRTPPRSRRSATPTSLATTPPCHAATCSGSLTCAASALPTAAGTRCATLSCSASSTDTSRSAYLRRCSSTCPQRSALSGRSSRRCSIATCARRSWYAAAITPQRSASSLAKTACPSSSGGAMTRHRRRKGACARLCARSAPLPKTTSPLRMAATRRRRRLTTEARSIAQSRPPSRRPQPLPTMTIHPRRRHRHLGRRRDLSGDLVAAPHRRRLGLRTPR